MKKNDPLLFIKTLSDGVIDHDQDKFDTRYPKLKKDSQNEVIRKKLSNIFKHFPQGTFLKITINGEEFIEDVLRVDDGKLILHNGDAIDLDLISDVSLVAI